jgi:hypothetical protein
LYAAIKIANGKAPTTSKSVRLSTKLDMPREFHDLRSRRFDGSGNILVIQCLELDQPFAMCP